MNFLPSFAPILQELEVSWQDFYVNTKIVAKMCMIQNTGPS